VRPRGKRYQALAQKQPEQPLSIAEAVAKLKSFGDTKFDQTVDCVIRLGIDPKLADQMIRGSISLPKGIGKSRRVIVFCPDESAEAAKAAGAAEAGADDLIKKVQDGWMDFDVAIAVPQIMSKVSRLGRVLGPQGKMPSPKTGTVTADFAKAVAEYAAGKVEFRNDSGGNVHSVVGKFSFSDDDLVANIDFLLGHIQRLKPSTAKGTYILGAYISGSMSPSVALAVS
jgi:large subunit ribosomal protein L1